MSDQRIDFRYLNEPDMIEAGVTDMARCVDVMEETLILLRQGDFRMAGATAMSHGAMIDFPKEPVFPTMPADGPDRLHGDAGLSRWALRHDRHQMVRIEPRKPCERSSSLNSPLHAQ